MKRSYGPQVKLDLHFPSNAKVSSFQIKEMLTNYKETIISLNIPCSENTEIFLNAVNKENITHVSLFGMIRNIEQLDNPRFGNLQYLKLVAISRDVALSLIKCNKDTITYLRLRRFDITESENAGIHIPKLRHLELAGGISGDVPISLIKCNKDTITYLRLDVSFRNTSLPVVEMPRLKHLYLLLFKKDYEAQIRLFIKAFGRNLTGLWTIVYDNYGQILCDNYHSKNYTRKSTEELNNLKMEALALQ